MDETVLRKLQLTELEILKKLHKLCEENGLTYYLVGGTLLGSVRHNGFIPWDDDLDIALPRNDYNKFIKLCLKGALGKDYFLHNSDTDPEYWLPFAKVKKNNTLFVEEPCRDLDCHKGIFVDVFPLDYCPKDKGIIYESRAKIIKKISQIILVRKLSKPLSGFWTTLMFYITKPLTIKQLSKIHDFLCSRYNDGPYIVNYGSNYKYTKQTMPKEYYEPAKQLQFEDGIFYVPNQYIKYLEHLFKDWEKLPPKDEQRNHNPSTIVFDTTMAKGQ